MNKAFSGITAALLFVVPTLAAAQHSHGASTGLDLTPRLERKPDAAPRPQPGVLPPGSARQIEVLVLGWGFSPGRIEADAREAVTLMVRRVNGACANGLAIPSRGLTVDLPEGETVAVPIELGASERVGLQCVDQEFEAEIVVRTDVQVR